METAPEIASLFEDGAYDLDLRPLIEQDDEGFFIEDRAFERFKDAGKDLAVARRSVEAALARLEVSPAAQYQTTMCCSEFRFSKADVSKVFSSILGIIDFVEHPERRLPLKPGKAYRCLKDIGNYRSGEEFSVLFGGRYAAKKPSLELGYDAIGLPRALHISGPENLERARKTFAGHFLETGTFDLDRALKEFRGDRT